MESEALERQSKLFIEEFQTIKYKIYTVQFSFVTVCIKNAREIALL